MARSSESTRSANAREQARKMQQEQERKQKRTSVLLRVGVVVVALAVIVGLVLFVVNRDDSGAAPSEGPAPAAANEQGGFVLTSSTELAEGDELGQIDASDIEDPDSEMPPGVAEREAGEVPHIIIYSDAYCIHCANFEAEHSAQMDEWLDEGLITLEYRSVSYLSSSTNYPARAANSFACMAEESPENYSSYVAQVTANRVTNDEMSNDQLTQLASETYSADIGECIEDGTYRAFASYTTRHAQAAGIEGTPSVYVDEVSWADSERPFRELVEEHIEEYQAEG
ncbi:DsbA family protein [Nesterenkonia sp. CF4.4]|uniref:DsbA family protein n=1 Tax=Nesterenkonia sp. CF4.4 TaxID=3373079 RepID=UPI003EE7DCCB